MQEDLLDRVESAFTLFRQHGGKARRQRKRARDKAGGHDEDAIVAALAKTGGSGDRSADDMDAEDIPDRTAGLPQARRAKVSINIFEDVDDRWVEAMSVGVLSGTCRPHAYLFFVRGIAWHVFDSCDF